MLLILKDCLLQLWVREVGLYLVLGTGEGDASKRCPVIHCPSNCLQLQLALEQGKTQPGLQGLCSPSCSFFSSMWVIPESPIHVFPNKPESPEQTTALILENSQLSVYSFNKNTHN